MKEFVIFNNNNTTILYYKNVNSTSEISRGVWLFFASTAAATFDTIFFIQLTCVLVIIIKKSTT